MGLVIALASWRAGKLAQHRGCIRTMVSGLVGMIVALVIGACFPSLPVQLAVLVFWAASQFMVWPALEALVTEGASGAARAHRVGVYSVVWAACSALSYFLGGGLFEWLGSGSIFWLPPGLHVLQLAVLWGYARRHGETPAALPTPPPREQAPALKQGPCPRSFQRMAWLANPFACVAAFTLLAMIPELARRMGLSTTQAGLFCSIWFFARLAAFVVMGQWPGWHYRFRWLLGGYLLLIAAGLKCRSAPASIHPALETLPKTDSTRSGRASSPTMRKIPEKKSTPRVALLIESSRSYGRELLMAGESAGLSSIVVKPLGVLARQSSDVLAIDDRQIALALGYIREHACDGLSVESLLKVIPLSRSVLERRFVHILGSSPKGEILRVRLDRVCQLLAESDLSLAEVAGKTGFEHPEYMSRLFKSKMGITPGEFRKQAGPGRLPLP
jgi:AraC-like DNA-binding protein